MKKSIFLALFIVIPLLTINSQWIIRSNVSSNPLYAVFFGNSLTGWIAAYTSLLHTTDGGSVGINLITTEVPSSYSLSQNYPNPFNPTTKIKFDIPSGFPIGAFGNDNVVLKVFDITGKEVATLVNEQLAPGTYTVDFDGTNFPSGVYFYQLRINNFSETKKLTLLK